MNIDLTGAKITISDTEHYRLEGQVQLIRTDPVPVPPPQPPPADDYPPYLKTKSIAGWKKVFAPDFSLPTDQLIGPDCVKTPFSFLCQAGDEKSGGTMYSVGNSTSAAGYPRGPHGGLMLTCTEHMQSKLITVDRQHRGHSWRAPVYLEWSCYPDYGDPSFGAFYTGFMQCTECYNPAFGGNRAGVASFNRGEIDFPECYADPQWGGPFDQAYNATILFNAGKTGPEKTLESGGYAGLSRPHVDPAFYNVLPSPLGASLWRRKITWGCLWLPDFVSLTRDNIEICKAPTPRHWTVPLLPNGQSQSMWFCAFVIAHNSFAAKRPATFRFTNEVLGVRVWQPAA